MSQHAVHRQMPSRSRDIPLIIDRMQHESSIRDDLVARVMSIMVISYGNKSAGIQTVFREIRRKLKFNRKVAFRFHRRRPLHDRKSRTTSNCTVYVHRNDNPKFDHIGPSLRIKKKLKEFTCNHESFPKRSRVECWLYVTTNVGL